MFEMKSSSAGYYLSRLLVMFLSLLLLQRHSKKVDKIQLLIDIPQDFLDTQDDAGLFSTVYLRLFILYCVYLPSHYQLNPSFLLSPLKLNDYTWWRCRELNPSPKYIQYNVVHKVSQLFEL